MSLDTIVKLIDLHKEAILVSSIGLFILTPIVVTFLIIYLPPNFFVQKKEKKGNLYWKWSKAIFKNLSGIILVTIGALMLILPGPGIIVMIIGVMLVQFPGKNRLKNFFLSSKALRKQLNWIRCQGNQEPFFFASRNTR